ncbi:PriCT-2 domain-containing protein [Sphingobium sp. CR2-8]|uniref:PriCT-2 domain-containing protein n=1 Tax=Sphingobium sp. CR2-8 TaxID=1306534 RepID=UPI002DB7ADDB|nr:PriCT-2 domain-containing protein [Sphingobium sp. CR2-8]MEC3910050.1 PriCT-2 domain-containing protein [Sphingobium sp. CR2-8]
MDDSPRQVSAQAIAFFSAIGRNGPLSFRVIMDDKSRKGMGVEQMTAPFDQAMQKLRRWNDAGYGIFVQVNASDGQGVTAANITAATCFFADFDGTPLENVHRLGIAPHVIVETSPGKRHYYWRVIGITLNQFTAVQKRLIALFGSDKSIHDLPRIMRLPGFLHQKNPDAPTLVTCTVMEGLAPYSISEFMMALSEAEIAHGTGASEGRSKADTIAALAQPKAGKAELARAEAALRHLIDKDALAIGDYSDWSRLGIALKNSYGEDGFALFLQVSSEDASFNGEDDVRKHWDGVKTNRPKDQQLTIATYFAKAKDAGWIDAAEQAAISGAGGGKVKPDAASIILDQAAAAGDEVFLSPDGKAYVQIAQEQAGKARHVTLALGGDDYRGILCLRYHEQQVVKTAPKDQVSAAVGILHARARQADVRHPVYLRVAHHEGRVYINLDPDKGVVAVIDPIGWRIMDEEPPVHFVAGSRGPLPMPQSGGSKATFARHFNVSPEDLNRVIGFLLSMFNDEGAYPILLVEGVAGSAKSNLGDKALALIDPPIGDRQAARFSMAEEERNLHIQASRCSMLYLDNISVFSADVADQLCRLASGAASSHRVLHSNDAEQLFFVRRPCIVSCIATPSSRGDLLSRSLRVTATRLEKRQTEAAVWRAFNADAGKMVGFLLDCVSAGLRNRAAVATRIEGGELALPRLADFAAWVEATGEPMGLEPGDFAALLNEEQESMQRKAVDGHPLIDALAAYFQNQEAKIEGKTARELRDMLAPYDRTNSLPAVNQFSAMFRRMAEGLRTSGFDVSEGRNGKRKVTTFSIATNDAFERKPADDNHGHPAAASVNNDGPLPF